MERYYPLDNFTAAITTTKTYSNLVFAIELTNDGATDIVVPYGALDITLKTGENRTIYLGGVNNFTVEATDDFRCLVYGIQ